MRKIILIGILLFVFCKTNIVFAQLVREELNLQTANSCSWDWSMQEKNILYSLDSTIENKLSLRIMLNKPYLSKKIRLEKIWGKFYLSDTVNREEISDSIKIKEQNSLEFIFTKTLPLPPYLSGEKCRMSLCSEDIIPLSWIKENDLSDIINNKRIIGLGECTHGSATIANARQQCVKEAILHHNCRLIIMEYPIDMSLLINMYILGLTTEKYGEEIKKDLRCGFGDYDQEFSLIKWLKDYNKQNKDKVYLFGIDNPAMPKMYLTEFFYYLLDKQNGHPYLKLIGMDKLDELANTINSNKTLEKKLDKNVIRTLQKNLKIYLYENTNNRDYNMYLRIQGILTNLLNEKQKAIILSHSVHLGRKQPLTLRLFNNNYFYLGNYLSKEFSNNYYAISFQIGQGLYAQDICSMFGDNLIENLPEAVVGSFEKSALETKSDYFFYSSEKLDNNLFSRRDVRRGGRNYNQFKFEFLQNHFDYIFIRDNSPCKNIEKFHLSMPIKESMKRKDYIRLFFK